MESKTIQKTVEKLKDLKKIYQDLLNNPDFQKDSVAKALFKKKVNRWIKEIDELIDEFTSS